MYADSGTVPLISVIVPIYKVEPYLKRCVDSILAQHYANLEILLVDDGSPDQCPHICDEYAEHDRRIRVIHKLNGGLSDARNAGMEAAQGEYIAFVDGDDYIAPEMISLLYEALRKSGDRIAICGFNKVTDAGELRRKTAMDFPERLTEDEFWYRLFFPNRDLGTVAWNKLYYRTLLRGLRFPVGKIHEDEWLVHQYISRAGHISVVNQCLYYYVIREGSITAQTPSPRSLSILQALSQRLEYFSETGKRRAVVLGMRNYAHYVIVFLSVWRKDKRFKDQVSQIREDFQGEIKRYKEYANPIDIAYWQWALHAPGLMRYIVEYKERSKRKAAR